MAGIDDILAGRFFDAVTNPFTTQAFPAELFFLFLFAGAMMLIFMKTRNYGMVSLTLVLTSVAVIPQVVPTVQQYFWAMMFFGIMGLIYSLFKGK